MAHLLVGTWSVDVSQLPMPPEARPRRVSIAFGEADPGAWRIRVEIVQADGQELISDATVALDGNTAMIEGDRLEADAIAAKRAAADVLVLALAKNGVPTSTRVYTVVPDGNRMVETAVHFDADGKAVMRKFHFIRVPQNKGKAACLAGIGDAEAGQPVLVQNLHVQHSLPGFASASEDGQRTQGRGSLSCPPIRALRQSFAGRPCAL